MSTTTEDSGGFGTSFAWAPDSNTYAVFESKVKLTIYKNFREKTEVYWSGTGNLVAIVAVDSFYVSKLYREAFTSRVEEAGEMTDEGVEEAFDIIAEIPGGLGNGSATGYIKELALEITNDPDPTSSTLCSH
ncbi:hypothetical protein DFP72DRAFT_1070873 [Ephemerocybe angulata]|uniref:Uncharacterized protein n=1 Tax=Ephemerocybe angulata TaxID=980116 RepID=A0A8H6HU09_9AGAR|nr:hypothetical protein DFP72DRAFT_1070873 [Tulosesus angulatus]